MIISILLLLNIKINFKEEKDKNISYLESHVLNIVKRYALDYEATPMSNEWKMTYQRDKGYLNQFDATPFQTELGKDVSSLEEFWLQKYGVIYDFTNPLRFCAFPSFEYNYRKWCYQSNPADLKGIIECNNSFCKMCCSMATNMLAEMSNLYSTTKKMGLQNTPGYNIINKLITDDEKEVCKQICNTAYPYATPGMKPKPPKIHNLGLSNTPNDPKAFSCNDIKAMAQDPKSGYYYVYIIDQYFKVYCDMENDGGGWMLLSSHMDQNQSYEINYVENKDQVDDLTEIMPQFVVEEDTVGVYKLFKWKNRFTNMNLVYKDKNYDDIPTKYKIKDVWLFCSLFKYDMKKDKILLHSQMSMILNDPEAINTVITGDRTKLEINAFNSLRFTPVKPIAYPADSSEENLLSDMPSFYHLHKLAHREENDMGQMKKIVEVNEFFFQKDKKVIHKPNVDSAGFTKDLVMGGMHWWSVRRESSDEFDKISNCDSFLTQDERGDYFSLHQVYVRMFEGSVDDIYIRADTIKKENNNNQ